jgi:hypothetical protein
MRAATFWAALAPILFIAAIVYVIYKIRRASQERRQRSDERATELLANLHAHAPARSAPAEPRPAAAEPRPMATAAQAARSVQSHAATALTRRARILTDAQRMLFLVLRAAMPEHLIMAHVRIVDLLDLADGAEALERDARLRTLARERLDFVVCDSDLVPLAGIVLYAGGIDQVPDESAKIQALREIGVRFLRFRADSVPRPAEVRNLVLA